MSEIPERARQLLENPHPVDRADLDAIEAWAKQFSISGPNEVEQAAWAIDVIDLLIRWRRYETAWQLLRRIGSSLRSDDSETTRKHMLLFERAGRLKLDLGEVEQALELMQNSLECARDLLDDERSHLSLRDYAVSLDNVADLEVAMDLSRQAFERYEESLAIRRELVGEFGETSESLRDVSLLSLARIADLERAAGNNTAALERYVESLEIQKEILRRFDPSLQAERDVLVSLGRIGSCAMSLNRPQEAGKRFEESISVARSVLAKYGSSPEALRDLSVSLEQMGGLWRAARHPATAQKFYSEGLEIRRRILCDFPRALEALRDLSVSLEACGDVQQAMGEREATLDNFRECLDLRRQILGEFGDAGDGLLEGAVACGRIVGIVGVASEEGDDRFREGWAMLESAIEQFGPDPQFTRALDWFKSMGPLKS